MATLSDGDEQMRRRRVFARAERAAAAVASAIAAASPVANDRWQ